MAAVEEAAVAGGARVDAQRDLNASHGLLHGRKSISALALLRVSLSGTARVDREVEAVLSALAST